MIGNIVFLRLFRRYLRLCFCLSFGFSQTLSFWILTGLMSMINVHQERGCMVYEEQRGITSDISDQKGISSQPNQSIIEPHKRPKIFGDNLKISKKTEASENPEVDPVGENKQKKPVDMSTNQSELRDKKQEPDPANANPLRSSRFIQVTQVKALLNQLGDLTQKNKQLEQKVQKIESLLKNSKKDKKAQTTMVKKSSSANKRIK